MEQPSAQAAGPQRNAHFRRSSNADAAHHAIPPKEEPPSKAELQEQYDLIDKSLDYLGLILAAVCINYYTLDAQKQQLFASLHDTASPFTDLDLFPFQLSAAVMILSASSFYFDVSQQALETPSPDPIIQESLQLNNYINVSLLIAAAVRIYNLFLVKFAPHPAQPTPLEEEEETETEIEDSLPVV